MHWPIPAVGVLNDVTVCLNRDASDIAYKTCLLDMVINQVKWIIGMMVFKQCDFHSLKKSLLSWENIFSASNVNIMCNPKRLYIHIHTFKVYFIPRSNL